MAREKRSALLMHPVRRDIYKIVSESPGSYFFEIASALELPHGTVSWHLKKLEEAGLLDTMRFAGRRVFFSKALRSKAVEKAFVVLRSEATQDVFTYILNNPGCYQAQIAEALDHHHDTIRHHIKRLKDAKLIISNRQGRTVHYNLGEVGKLILDSNTEVISRAYIEYLFSRLEEECLTPELVEQERGMITIKISCAGKDDAYFSINLNGWSFLPNEIAEDRMSDDDLDLDEYPSGLSDIDQLNSMEETLSRPKVSKIDE